MAEDRKTEKAGAGVAAGAASTGMSRRRGRKRAFYSIGEVCDMFDLKPHVLRYWETQFPELSPTKNRAGNRVYRPEELELIALIRKLVHEERYTLEGARQKLSEMSEEGQRREESSRALERAFLGHLRAELESVLELLDSGKK